MDRETSKVITRMLEKPSFEELAAAQGVRPVGDFDTLLGHPSDGDESAAEFSAMLREWRHEGVHTRPQ